MTKLIQVLENKVIRKYGFEAKATVLVFRATELLRKIMK